jgi:hypothetical protein
MKLRPAINRKFSECVYDPETPGTRAQQIAVCTSKSCPLFDVRPKTAKVISPTLLDFWRLSPEEQVVLSRQSPQYQNERLP